MGKKEKKKGKFKKKLLTVVGIIFISFVVLALLDDTDYEDTDNNQEAKTEIIGGEEYVVKEPVGFYRSFSSKVADESSEEIMELAGGKHFVNQSFDHTEYATTINDEHSGNWGIYIYMCGSDLESEGGAATSDIEEILDSDIPEGSNVVIQAGGANSWNIDVDPDSLSRFVYDGENFELVDDGEQQNMGSQETLEGFLDFCKTNYPADNEVVIFWNHGGASISGACYDELYEYDHLTLNEIDRAFTNVYGTDRIEMVGFDCCLMATLDTAELLRNHAKTMVASEELEPGNGWYYTDWLNALNENPSLSNAELGKAICDAFMYGCELEWTEDECTLSLIDLTQINLVTASMNALGAELLSKTAEGNPEVFVELGRAASSAENYGGNNDSSGYFNMVDLGDLYDQCSGVFDSEEYARYALNRAVAYNVHGSFRSEASGISVFYPYDKTEVNMQKIEAVTASDIYTGALRYSLTGEYSDETADLIKLYNEVLEDSKKKEVVTKNLNNKTESLIYNNNGENVEVYIDDDGYISTDIGQDIDAVESVICEFLMYDENEDEYIALGYDNDVDVDWESGVIKDNFRGVWACLGGHRLYLDIVYEGEDYNIYSVPVMVNGMYMDMSVSYDFNTDSFKLLGLTDSVDTESSNVFATKNKIMPKTGDKITLIGYTYDIENEEWSEVEYDSFEYNEDMTIKEEDLDDGEYALLFITTDVAGNEVYSEYGYLEVVNGEVMAYTEDDLVPSIAIFIK